VEVLPRALEAKRRSLERALGRPVQVRGIRTPDRELRGRLLVEPDRVVIEYQIAEHGYFWHVPIIEELLNRAARGEPRAELRDEPADADAGSPPGR
jgi:G:T-mismatch repair DNA endonuclease (very short patch repair protein)